jgi:hypothetical protein
VGTNYRFSSLERQEIHAAKSHLFTPTPGSIRSWRSRRVAVLGVLESTDESKVRVAGNPPNQASRARSTATRAVSLAGPCSMPKPNRAVRLTRIGRPHLIFGPGTHQDPRPHPVKHTSCFSSARIRRNASGSA